MFRPGPTQHFFSVTKKYHAVFFYLQGMKTSGLVECIINLPYPFPLLFLNYFNMAVTLQPVQLSFIPELR